ncbi:GtrA family protein [Bacillus seohaeanensis]|jgi:putative flippase GtrA|uniref:GtrA family protein n=1 Tax=Bacillus seohaeanensis TaxID=284580 RepID=A0ABW5RV14_9BACI
MSLLSWPLESYRKRINPFVKFLLVGLVNTFVGLSVIFILLTLLEQSYWLSTFSGNGVGAFVSYLLNRKFTFESNVPHVKGGLRFILIVFSSYVISYYTSFVLASWFTELFSFTFFLTQKELAVVGGTVLYTVTNFLGQKYIVFKEN